MKKRLAIFIAVLALAVLALPTFAYGGVGGTVIDNLTSTGWTHGGEVYVLNGSGNIVASGSLAGDGSFDLTYGTDDLTVCGGPCAAASGTMTVAIDFTCAIGGGCTPPVGTPATNTSCTYSELGLPFDFNCGGIQTGTGPSAVTLNSVSTASSSAAGMGIVAAGIALLALASAFFLRRKGADIIA